MKILLVSSGSGSRGGGELYLGILASGLVEMGCQVGVVVPDGPRMDELAQTFANSVRILRVPVTPTYDRRFRGISAAFDRREQDRLVKIFRTLSPDIIHINQQVAEDGLDLVIAAQRSRYPWISTIHVGLGAAALGARLGMIRDGVTRSVITSMAGDHIGVSKASTEQLVSRFGGSRARFHTVMNGVCQAPSADLARARREARAEWGVSDNDIIIGAVGRIEQQKEPLAFVRYLSSLGGDGSITGVWVGDGSLRAELEDSAARVSLRLVVDGWRADAASRLAGFDLLLMPSRFEGLPLALLEAMHAGIPAVASRVDGIAEAVTDQETGFLCLSSQQWSDALRALVSNAELRRSMGAKAALRARQLFSAGAMAAATHALYEKVVARSSNHDMRGVAAVSKVLA